jgi:hypothetical protein
MTTNKTHIPPSATAAHELSLAIPSRFRGADSLLLRIEDAGTDGAYLVAGIDRFDAPWAAFDRTTLAARLREMADALDPASARGAVGGGEARPA